MAVAGNYNVLKALTDVVADGTYEAFETHSGLEHGDQCEHPG